MGEELTEKILRSYLATYDAVLNPSGLSRWSPPLSALDCDVETVSELSSLTKSYHRVLEHIASQYASFSDYLGFDADLHGLLSSLPAYGTSVPLGRLDVFYTPSGLKVIEANTESPGGAEECDTIDRLFALSFPDKVSGAPRRRLDGFVQVILESYAEQAIEKHIVPSDRPSVVLLEWPEDVRTNGVRYDLFIDHARNHGLEVSIASPADVVFKDGKALVDDVSVDIFYRRFLIHELPERHVDGYDFVKRLEDSSSVMVNPGISKAAGCKQVLALISDPAYGSLFPDEFNDDIAYLRTSTPPTYSLLHPEMLSFPLHEFLSSKDDYVLKAGNGASSKAVWIGTRTSRDDWVALVRGALGRNYVLQEKVDMVPMSVDLFAGGGLKEAKMFYLLSPYMLSGTFGGVYARATENELLSSHEGGLATILPAYEK